MGSLPHRRSRVAVRRARRSRGAVVTGGPRIHVVATLRDEAPWLVEWLVHYRLLGASGFTLFSNDCTDGTDAMLDRLDRMGVVRHVRNPIGPGQDPQRRAYSRARERDEVAAADYVLVVDADEFAAVHVGDRSLPALIERCGGPDAISLGWRLMGSDGKRRWRDRPVTRRFRRGGDLSAPEHGLATGFKTLFRPDRFDYFGVHRPRFRKDRDRLPPRRWLNGSGAQMPAKILHKGWRFNRRSAGYALGHVAHYAVKSREEFLLKRARGSANGGGAARLEQDYWARFDLNAAEDRSLPLPDLADAMAELMADAELATLRRAAIARGRARVEAFRRDPGLRAFLRGDPPGPCAGETGKMGT